MRLKNKKTGAIYKIEDIDLGNNQDGIWLGMTKYTSLAELNEEWEDYEEPKVFYYIKSNGYILKDNDTITKDFADDLESIGNYFKTKEEAEQAVESLMAWKRLKDKGFRFKGVKNGLINWDFSNNCADLEGCEKCLSDFRLLFGGEE